MSPSRARSTTQSGMSMSVLSPSRTATPAHRLQPATPAVPCTGPRVAWPFRSHQIGGPARSARHGPTNPQLASFFVGGVGAAEPAVLLELDPLAVVEPVLLAPVVPVLARLAGEGDLHPLVACHLFFSSIFSVAAGGFEPPTTRL